MWLEKKRAQAGKQPPLTAGSTADTCVRGPRFADIMTTVYIEEIFDDLEQVRLKEKTGKDSDLHDLSRNELIDSVKLAKDKAKKRKKEISALQKQHVKLQQLLYVAVGVSALAIVACIGLAAKVLTG